MTLRKILIISLSFICVSALSACSEARYAAHVVKQIPLPSDAPKTIGHFKVGSPYRIKGRRYTPQESYNLTERGTASWYGPGFHGRQTANGEIFDKYELTAAHRTLQLPSIIRVTNLQNGRSIILRVNDRGPFAHDRILDVSDRAASVLGFKNAGTAKIKLEVLAEPSREVARRARAGQDTKGFEVVLNQNNGEFRYANNDHLQLPKPKPVTEVQLSSQTPIAPPPALRKPLPVQAESIGVLGGNKVFVQAGSFSQEANALAFSKDLSRVGPSRVYMTRVNDKPFFRVRLGPYQDRAQAQKALDILKSSGNKNAVIVME